MKVRGAARLGAGEVSLLVVWVLLLGGREILEEAKTPYDRRLPVVGPVRLAPVSNPGPAACRALLRFCVFFL